MLMVRLDSALPVGCFSHSSSEFRGFDHASSQVYATAVEDENGSITSRDAGAGTNLDFHSFLGVCLMVDRSSFSRLG